MIKISGMPEVSRHVSAWVVFDIYNNHYLQLSGQNGLLAGSRTPWREELEHGHCLYFDLLLLPLIGLRRKWV